jgi:hypothetical protein
MDPKAMMEDARGRCIQMKEEVERITNLNKIENFTREYLLMRRIEIAVPDPDWATRQEIESARERGARIFPAVSSAAPQLRKLNETLLGLSGALYKASHSASGSTHLQNKIVEQRKRVRDLIRDVELAIQVLSEPESAYSEEFYEPKFQGSFAELSKEIDQISEFKEGQYAKGEQGAAGDGDKPPN